MSNKTIGNTCYLINGYAFKSSLYVDNGIRVIRIANVQKGYIEDSTPAFYPLDSKGLENYMLKDGDLLMSLTGNVGRVALLSGEMLPAALNQRVACLRLKDNSVDKRFLFHYLNSSNFENECIQESKGVAQKNMSTEWLKRQEIPNFTYSKQKEISKVLDKISDIVKFKTRQLTEYDQLIKSRFVEMFEYIDLDKKQADWIKVSEVAEIVTGTTPSTSDGSNWGGINLWITPAELNEDSFYIYDTERKISDNGMKSKSLVIMPIDTVLLSTRAPIGKTAIIGSPMSCNQGFKNFICGDKLNPIYLYSLLKFNKGYLNSIGSGTTFKEISKAKVSNIEIPVPSIELQNEFALFVKHIDKLKFCVKQSLNESQKLFDSLMQVYFE